jgi:hypothetical protein
MRKPGRLEGRDETRGEHLDFPGAVRLAVCVSYSRGGEGDEAIPREREEVKGVVYTEKNGEESRWMNYSRGILGAEVKNAEGAEIDVCSRSEMVRWWMDHQSGDGSCSRIRVLLQDSAGTLTAVTMAQSRTD